MKFLKNITPREYQQKIFETCSKKNCLVVLPTGLGKTLIAVMLAIQRLREYPSEKVLFLAPTKPLVEQHLKTFKKNLPELFAEMDMFTGSVNPKKRKKIWQNADIIFSTPQCIANDLKKNLYDLKDVCLLVEDEAHRCVKNYDYTYIAETYKNQAQNPRIIGLTASPGSDFEKIKTICKNLSIEEIELRTRESDDVKKYLQKLNFEKINVEFPPEFIEIKQVLLKLFNEYVEELRNRKVLFKSSSKKDLIELQKKLGRLISKNNKNFNYFHAASACAQAIKLQHALELLETQTLSSFTNYMKKLFSQAAKKQNKGILKLTKKPGFNYAYIKANELISKNIEHPKIDKIVSIVEEEIKQNSNSKIIVFTQYRETAEIISKRLNEIPNINSKIFVGQAKKTSASGKTTGMNQKQQKQIIEEFSNKKINVLCATCIAEEGLDIPEVNAVIFYEPIPSAIRAIQRAGRTARLKKGKLIILMTKNTRDETFYYVSRSRQKKMDSIIKKVKKDIATKKINIKEKQKTL